MKAAATDPPDGPSPPPTVIVAGLLRLIGSGLEGVEVEPYGPDRPISITTASGWWLVLHTDHQGDPVELSHAQPPSALVPPWTWGCQRDDWTLGPESRVITPVELLTGEQRERLRRRLEAAPIRRQWTPPQGWDVSNLDEEVFQD